MNKKLFIFAASIIFLAISGIAGADNNMFLLSPHAKSSIISVSDSSLVNSFNQQEDTDETTGLSRNAKIAIGVGVGALVAGGIAAAIIAASGNNGKKADESIAIQADTDPANQHLSYRAFDIINTSTQDYQITSLSLASAAAGAAAQNELKLCGIDSGDECSANFASTCKPNEILPSGKTCNLWLHAVDGTAPLGPQIAILTIGVNNTVATFSKQGKFTINYSRDLYAGGGFTAPMGGGYNIAKWNGSQWGALGGGLGGDSNVVFALTQDKDGDLIAGGSFPIGSGYNIAKWNGSQWSTLGNGLGDQGFTFVLALTQDKNGDLIAGGLFPIGSGYNIAKWNADTQIWGVLGSTGLGESEGGVAALTQDKNGDLIAGGEFQIDTGYNIAKWNGSQWSILGTTGLNEDAVSALTQDKNGDLIAGGSFSIGTETFNVAKLDAGTQTWGVLGDGLGVEGDEVLALTQDKNDDLIAGGSFPIGTGYNIAKLSADEQTWSVLGSTGLGINDGDRVLALAQDKNGDLIAGGDFLIGEETYNIAKLDADAQTWSALGGGLGGYANGVASLLIVPSIQSVQKQ